MKKYLVILLLFPLLSIQSCLEMGLEDLPEYEDANITGVQRVEYRYIDETTISPTDGQAVVKYVNLTRSTTVDTDAATVSIKVTVPNASAAFPANKRDACTTSNLCVMVSLSTAAHITPQGNAPKLGVPGDWSKPNTYVVEAADGTTRTWTIQITSFTK